LGHGFCGKLRPKKGVIFDVTMEARWSPSGQKPDWQMKDTWHGAQGFNSCGERHWRPMSIKALIVKSIK